MAGIKARLKDPDSAKFGPMSAARSDSTGVVRVCGTVNAHNSFGGYSGSSRFVAHLTDDAGEPRLTDAAIGISGADTAVNLMCRAARL
jgi:hypothetical protein